MALFNKFFFSSSTNKKKSNNNANQCYPSSQFPFDSQQVRILLYRECDVTGRRLLFDSSSIEKVIINNEKLKRNNENNVTNQKNKTKFSVNKIPEIPKSDSPQNETNYIEISNGIGYKHNRPIAADISNLGEMIFGALAMSFRSPSLKVHWLQAPSRLLCSQVFLSPIPGANTNCFLNQTDMLHKTSNKSDQNFSNEKKHKFMNKKSQSFDGYSVIPVSNSRSTNFKQKGCNNQNLSLQLSTLPIVNDCLLQNPINILTGISLTTLKSVTHSQSVDDPTTPTTIGSDSGYTTFSDCWTSLSSYQYSTRSSMGSVLSDPLSTYDNLRKFSIDSVPIQTSINLEMLTNSSYGQSPILYSRSVQQLKSKANSDLSISRRIRRNLQTSFENRDSICDFVGFISDNYQFFNSTIGSPNYEKCGKKIQSNRNDSYTRAKNDRLINSEGQSSPEMYRNQNNVSTSNVNMFDMLGIPSCKYSTTKDCKTHSKSCSKRSKLGLAVCISMCESQEKEMEEFCCEHIALFESMLSRLRASAEYAYLNHKKFLKIMFHTWQKACEWISDIFCVPRLNFPIWHSLTSDDTKSRRHLADNFIKEFCLILRNYDSKETNFFVSTLITAVLTHHLAWVSTIASTYSSNLSRSSSSNSIRDFANEKQEFLKSAANQYPYNPFWAQICDIYGAIGYPPKVSRTILIGKHKIIIEKFLQVLTYFIRCSEIRCNDFGDHQLNIDSINQLETDENLYKMNEKCLSRNSTLHNNLCDTNMSNSSIGSNCETNTPKIPECSDFKYSPKNLFLENTGSGSNPSLQKPSSKEKIKFTITTPDDVEISISDEIFLKKSLCKNTTLTEPNKLKVNDFDAIEAIEVQDFTNLNFKNQFDLPNVSKKLRFWNFEPNIKEGLSLTDVKKLQNRIEVSGEEIFPVINLNTTTNFASFNTKSQLNHLTLIPENIIDKSDSRKSELKKHIISSENFDLTKQHLSNGKSLQDFKNKIINNQKEKSVLFVLGENEHLINLKTSSENLTVENLDSNNLRNLENGNVSERKNLMGVKFNFSESFEDIVQTSNKLQQKLDFKIEEKPINYDFWTRCICDSNIDGSSLSKFDLKHNISCQNVSSTFICEFCKKKTTLRSSVSNEVYPIKFTNITEKSNNSGKHTLISPTSTNKEKVELKEENISCLPISNRGFYFKKMFQNIKDKTRSIENLNLKILPMPNVKNMSNSLENLNFNSFNSTKSNSKKTGFIPSLFVGVNDHYIADIALQGTTQPFKEWEINLKNDLTIAAHCGSLGTSQSPIENIAIIADIDNCDVKMVSSKNVTIPYTSSANGPIGMSQIVLQLLEGFSVMGTTGISSYECLEYLETRLKEIYYQSEALAGLLLSTEFCSLNAVTSALNLSENDIPLLLAIASVHSPQVTKRYGISFG